MKKVFIIAEAGVNHNGDVEIAKKLIDTAAEAGADAVKFQTFKASTLLSKTAPKAEYQKQLTSSEESQFEMIRKLELDLSTHHILIDYCKTKGIQFLSTPFDIESTNLLVELDLPLLKIPSGEITNLPYLWHLGAQKKPVIMSTGMATIGEIENALDILLQSGLEIDSITLLHCNTEYPTPMSDVNLLAMQTIQTVFPGVEIGYSDHTAGIEVATAAVALGAQVIEKHFTLDKRMEGPDHQASLEPDELQAMVRAIRNIEQALGSARKQPSPSESKNKAIARKSLIAATAIQEGDVFTEKNIAVKRPGTGIDPMRWHEIIGKRAIRDFQLDELIEQ